MAKYVSDSSQGFTQWRPEGFGPVRRDEYGYFWSIDLYVYIGFADSGYSDLKAGQVIARFIFRK